VRDYLAVGRELSVKVRESLARLCDQPVELAHWEALAYFHRMLDKHLNLVERRRLKEETIPAAEKVFSLFEPHTEWIQKGKPRPNVKLGHRLLIATDQNQLIQDYDAAAGVADVDRSVPVVVMPKRGQKNAAAAERESQKQFVALRKQHSAGESEINSLEHHGLNRCLDVGIQGCLRYAGYGVMSYNLHLIGRELLARTPA
jgi:hypothetical protein